MILFFVKFYLIIEQTCVKICQVLWVYIYMYVQELVGSGFWSCSPELTTVKTVPHGFCFPPLNKPPWKDSPKLALKLWSKQSSIFINFDK